MYLIPPRLKTAAANPLPAATRMQALLQRTECAPSFLIGPLKAHKVHRRVAPAHLSRSLIESLLLLYEHFAVADGHALACLQRDVRIGAAAPVMPVVFASSCDVFEVEAVLEAAEQAHEGTSMRYFRLR